MNLHEFQTKKLFRIAGIPVPKFGVAYSVEEALQVADELNLQEAVVKIQVHAGGRGKAGGVKIARSRKEIGSIAEALIGMRMVNQQTGPEGVIAPCVMVSEMVEIAKESYMSALVDRKSGMPILLACSEGGVDIEEVAHRSPEKIARIAFGLDGKLRPYQAIRLTKCMGWKGEVAKRGIHIAEALAKCFLENDASMLEINPLVETPKGELLAIDSKGSIDDNALFSHSNFFSYFDPSQISPQEAEAREQELSYVAMHGNIGCMVNGAGLAMATMDAISLCGGAPANFLDVGGSASKEKIAFGFRLILADPKVEAIFIHIFGGIMNCALLAEGVIAAVESEDVKVPIVVRMEGTNVEEGKRLFRESGMKIRLADTLEMGAREAVRAAKE